MGHYAAKYLHQKAYHTIDTTLAEEELREISGKGGP
jgi:hypothetical protein